MIYRIYTEDTAEHATTLDIVSRYFDGFTTYFAVVGYWRGQPESSLVIEILTDEPPSVIARLAEDIRAHLNQATVLIVALLAEATLIEAGTLAEAQLSTNGHTSTPAEALESVT